MYTYILKDQGCQTNFLRGEEKERKKSKHKYDSFITLTLPQPWLEEKKILQF